MKTTTKKTAVKKTEAPTQHVTDEATIAGNIRLMAERLGLSGIDLVVDQSGAAIFYIADEAGITLRYSARGGARDALLEIHEQLRAELLTRIALDHDVLTRVRGTHAIRRRRDAEWYAAQRSASKTPKG